MKSVFALSIISALAVLVQSNEPQQACLRYYMACSIEPSGRRHRLCCEGMKCKPVGKIGGVAVGTCQRKTFRAYEDEVCSKENEKCHYNDISSKICCDDQICDALPSIKNRASIPSHYGKCRPLNKPPSEDPSRKCAKGGEICGEIIGRNCCNESVHGGPGSMQCWYQDGLGGEYGSLPLRPGDLGFCIALG